MKRKPLASLEWEIMCVIWDSTKKTTVRDVLEKGFPNGEKAYTTVQTVMNNLVDKNYLKKEKIGMVNFYTSKVAKNINTKSELNQFVKKVFDGSAFSLINQLIGDDYLSKTEIDNLKNLLKKNKLKE